MDDAETTLLGSAFQIIAAATRKRSVYHINSAWSPDKKPEYGGLSLVH